MSFFGVGNLGNLGNPFSTVVGQKIEQATDGSLSSENWALNMEICDIINSTADGPKDAIKAIKKRLTQSAGKNYTVVMYTLTVLETCVKNCGKQFHILVCNKEFIGELVKMIGPKNDPPTVVQEKVLSLIQCWADAFQNQPELQGVLLVYNELKTKGVEFPMTDLDAMAPIFTPQRSVPDGGEPVSMSPVRSSSPSQPPGVAVTLSGSQLCKLRADLSVVEGNMSVMGEMLNELTAQPHNEHHPADLDLLNELASTLRAMQVRVAELVGRLAGDAPLTADLLLTNDQLNNLLLRHSRFLNNRKAATTGSSPSAILGAAMGVPGQKGEEDSLIDLSDEVPDIAKLTVNEPQPKPKSPGGTSKDEFDMFAQSRGVSYENTKTGGSSYADNTEDQSTTGLAIAANQRPTQGQLPQEMDQREIDEIAAWLAQEKVFHLTRHPYWWSEELADLRRECIRYRRQYTRYRSRKRKHEQEEKVLYDTYRTSKKGYHAAIAQAKASAQDRLAKYGLTISGTFLASSESMTQESVSSSDFERFLAERAAAADNLPNANENRSQNTPQQTPRHRQIKKEGQDAVFEL